MALAAVVCVSGCTTGSDSPKVTPTTKSVSADKASTMKEGRDYDLVATLPAKIQGVQPRYLGVSPDDMVFGDIFIEDPDAEPPIGPGGTALTGRSSVFLLDPESGKVTEVLDGAVRKEPSGVTGMDADDEWVVWLESLEGGFSSGRWTLYSYERGTGKIRKLGAYDDKVVAPKAELGYERLPVISGTDAVMATSVIDRKDKLGKANQVLSAPLDGSAPLSELARGARSVDADAEGLSYVDVTGALMFRDAVSGETTVIDDGKSECRTYRSGVLVTCSPYGSGTTFRVRAKNGTTTTFGPFDGDVGYNYQETGWVKFVTDPDGDPTIYAIDTDRMKLFKVADIQGGWQLMGHDMALVAPFDGVKGDITLIKLR
jgi:hypothetical protein